MAQYIKILPVTEKDLVSVYNLSNLDSVRAVSFCSEKIEFSNHKKWFAANLSDPNTIMLKAMFKENFAGQVRLNIKDDVAIIGISVDEQYRSRGIASKLLQAAIEEIKKRDVKTIEAFIKPDNIASIGLFEKNGFIFKNETKVTNVKANKYLYKL